MKFSTPSISTFSLIAANLFAAFGVLRLGWHPADLLLLYWFENIAVGALSVYKMATWPVPRALKMFTVPFFCVHYGLFCFGHLVFLTTLISAHGGGVFESLHRVLPGIAVFFASHAASAFVYRRMPPVVSLNSPERLIASVKSEFDQWFWRPYKRVVVMHLAVIFGFFATDFFHDIRAAALLLIVLKTVADLGSHVVLHRRASV